MPVDALHPTVTALSPKWTRVIDATEDVDAIKAKTTEYLPKLAGQQIYTIRGETINEYDNYLARAVWIPYPRRTVQGLLGLVMRKDPEYAVPEIVAPQLVNITLTGVTHKGLVKFAVRENLRTSFGGIAVDYSNRLKRPYQRLYGAQAVRNWRFVDLDGVPVLDQLVLSEKAMEPGEDGYGTREVDQLRVFELVKSPAVLNNPRDYPLGRVLISQVYRKVKTMEGKEEWMPYGPPVRAERQGQPLGFIPFQPFNANGATFEPDLPVTLDVADLALAFFRNSADYENLIHFTGCPTLALAGFPKDMDIRVGGNTVFRSENPSATASYAMTGGAGGEEIRTAMDVKKQEMATVGARLLLAEQKKAVETAESQEIRLAGDDATLTSIATSTGMALERAMIWHTWWATTMTMEEAEKAVKVTLNTDYLTHQMSGAELVQLMAVVQDGLMSEDSWFFNANRGERIPPGRTFEDEQKLIAEDQKRREARGIGMPTAMPGADEE